WGSSSVSMNSPSLPPETLRQALAGARSQGFIADANCSVALAAVAQTSALGSGLACLAGKSVLLAVDNQLEAALALIDLDGVAGRIVLTPPGIAAHQLPAILRDAAVDEIVCTDQSRY